jgi:hypothetical protein
LLTALAAKTPSHWLELCNNVLSGASEKTKVDLEQVASPAPDKAGDDEEDKTTMVAKPVARTVAPTRWESKVSIQIVYTWNNTESYNAGFCCATCSQSH